MEKQTNELPKVSFNPDNPQTSRDVIKALERVKIAKSKLNNCQLKELMEKFYSQANRLIMDDMSEQYQQAEAARYADEFEEDPPTKRVKRTIIDNRNT